MKLFDLEKTLYEKLNMEQFRSSDPSLNGVQVGDLDSNIKKVALMVDASLEGFKQANKSGADLILCHHGLFWGSPLAIKGSHYKRVQFLIKNNISLIAAHLPLDSHPELGNNIGLANALNLVNIKPFGKYKSNFIGLKGYLPTEKTLSDIKQQLVGNNEPAYMIPGGKNKIKSVAIVSGGAPDSVFEAIEQGIDLFITGDISHQVYHSCLEEGINMVSLGHYATETWGVRLVGKWLEKEFNLETTFIDIPTGA